MHISDLFSIFLQWNLTCSWKHAKVHWKSMGKCWEICFWNFHLKEISLGAWWKWPPGQVIVIPLWHGDLLMPFLRCEKMLFFPNNFHLLDSFSSICLKPELVFCEQDMIETVDPHWTAAMELRAVRTRSTLFSSLTN